MSITVQKITYSTTVTKIDGSIVTHTAEFTAYHVHETVSGVIAIEAICDGDERSRKRHTLPSDLTSYTDAQLMAEIQAHVRTVCLHHAAVDRATDYLNSLLPAPPLPSLQPAPAPQGGH